MNQSEIERKASNAASEVAELKAVIKQLQARVERQALVIGTLKDIVLAEADMPEDEFLTRLQAAAAKKVDANLCAKCGKPMSAKHVKCIYCGEPRPTELI
jgi:hypothetical protein